MAARQAAEAQNGNAKSTKAPKGKKTWVLIGGGVLLLVGLAAGAGIWKMQNPPGESAKIVQSDVPDIGNALMPLGRITVNVAAAGALSEKRSRYLVIEPTLLYAASFNQVANQPKMEDFKSALRDSYIEFLSQLHENDVYGSAGLAELRSELLRRARLVTKSDAPISILLQDFVLQ